MSDETTSADEGAATPRTTTIKDAYVGAEYVTPRGHRVLVKAGGRVVDLRTKKEHVLPPEQALTLADPDVVHTSQSRMGDFERCPRYWYQRSVLRLETPQSPTAAAGERIHKQLEDYVLGRSPTVFGAAAKASRFYPRPQTPAPGIVLDVEWLFRVMYAGAGLTGKVDLLTAGVREWGPDIEPLRVGLRILDLKTTGSVRWAKTAEQLKEDRQLLSYLLAAKRAHPEMCQGGSLVELGQVVVERDPPHAARLTLVTVGENRALEQEEADRPLIARMAEARRVDAERWRDVDGPADRSSCERWFGAQCPFHSRCHGKGTGTTSSGLVDFAAMDGGDGRGGEQTRRLLLGEGSGSGSGSGSDEAEGVDLWAEPSAPAPKEDVHPNQEIADRTGASVFNVVEQSEGRRGWADPFADERPITSFNGPYRFLSNFYEGHPLHWMGKTWPTAEHAYQAAKTHDDVARDAVRACTTPGEAKKMGRRLQLRPDWEQVKRDVMEGVVWEKFSDPLLADRLIATGDRELIEGNTWGDRYWGKVDGVGRNELGKILMITRDELRKRRAPKDKEKKDMGIINPPDAAAPVGVGSLEGVATIGRKTLYQGHAYRMIKGERHDREWELRLWNGEGGQWKFVVTPSDVRARGALPGVVDLDIEQLRAQVLHPVLLAWDEEVAAKAPTKAPSDDPFADIEAVVREVDDPAASGRETARLVAELMSRGVPEGRAGALVAGGVTLARLQAGEVTLPQLLACNKIGEKTARALLEQFERPAPVATLAKQAEQPAKQAEVVVAKPEESAAPLPVVTRDEWAEEKPAPRTVVVPTEAKVLPETLPSLPTRAPIGYRLLIGARVAKGEPSVEFLDLVRPWLDKAAALPHKLDDGTRRPVADVLLVPYLGAACAIDDLLRDPPPFDGRWIVVNQGCPYWAKLQRVFLDRAASVIYGV